MGTCLRELFKTQSIKKACMILGLVIIVFIIVWARALYGSMKAYHQGEVYFKGRQYIKAITFFDRSLHWYTPFNPYVRKSADRLWEIGKHAELKGDITLALIAFRTIRRGFHAAGSFITPGKNWIKRCEDRITKLVMMEERQRRDSGYLESVEKHLPKGQKNLPPSIYWSIILEIGFLGWIGSVIGFIVCILGSKGGARSLSSLTITWISLTFVFFALWIVGMMKA